MDFEIVKTGDSIWSARILDGNSIVCEKICTKQSEFDVALKEMAKELKQEQEIC